MLGSGVKVTRGEEDLDLIESFELSLSDQRQQKLQPLNGWTVDPALGGLIRGSPGEILDPILAFVLEEKVLSSNRPLNFKHLVNHLQKK